MAYRDTFTSTKPTFGGLLPAPAPIRGRVTLFAPETGGRVTGRYSEPPQVIAERSANGAWQPLPRLKRLPLSSWSGPQGVKIQAKIRFDGLDTGTSVAPQLRDLRELQDRLPGDDAADRPPYLLVVGYVPGHYGKVRWQIDDLQVSEDEHLDGRCVQALATITLAEWESSEIDVRVQHTRTAASTYRWRKGDTLRRVAKRELGSGGEQAQKAIRDANPGKRFARIEPGDRIKIPSKTVTS